MKKFIALVLAIVLMAAFSVPAFAATRNVVDKTFTCRVKAPIYTSKACTSYSDTVGAGVLIPLTFNTGRLTCLDAFVGYMKTSDVKAPVNTWCNAVFTSSILQKGDVGTAVGNLQLLLNMDFQIDIAVDKDFGPATVSAVKFFQNVHGLKPDGLVV